MALELYLPYFLLPSFEFQTGNSTVIISCVSVSVCEMESQRHDETQQSNEGDNDDKDDDMKKTVEFYI